MPSTRTGKGRMENCEDIEKSVSEVLKIRNFLTAEEEIRIHHQLRSSSWVPNHQVLWSGIFREQAQAWADGRNMQTLTTAMGPLMDPRASSCLKNRKSNNSWSKYVHGASAVFAWHIAMEDTVTVLCPPPPQRFHPSGLSSYQTIEEPILKAAIADGASLRIELVHPRVNGAEDFWYEMWPVDEVDIWINTFGTTGCRKCVWRMVKGDSPSVATEKATKSQTTPAPAHAKTTAKATEKTEVNTLSYTVNQPGSPKKSKKNKKRKRSQKTSSRCGTPVTVTSASSLATQSKSTSHYTSPPAGQKKTNLASKLAMSLETTSSPDKATKKAKRKTQKATTAQGQEPISKQAQKAATSKKTKKNRGTKKTFQTATSPDQSGSKPKTTASQKRKARKETQASHAVAGNDEQLAASTCASESAKVEKTAGQAKQEVTQEDAVYETWLDY